MSSFITVSLICLIFDNLYSFLTISFYIMYGSVMQAQIYIHKFKQSFLYIGYGLIHNSFMYCRFSILIVIRLHNLCSVPDKRIEDAITLCLKAKFLAYTGDIVPDSLCEAHTSHLKSLDTAVICCSYAS